MNKLNALQTAHLSAVAITSNLDKYVELINRHVKPPVEVNADEVNIRAMYVLNDRLNSYGGKFDRVDLPAIARLFIDSPVLVGHDKNTLPVARNFWAETVEKGGHLWIKSYFYWLKNGDEAHRLRVNIDAGIYKECSVSFLYGFPQCSVCGEDIRRCGHRVGGDVFFYYRDVEAILETSLVYRGSVADTHITNELQRHTRPLDSDVAVYTLVYDHQLRNIPGATKQLETFEACLGSSRFLLARRRSQL